MYVTMNRFKIKPEYADDYVTIWEDARINPAEVDGFLAFKFFRLDSHSADYVLFSSYALWENKDKFLAWTHSDHFKNSHRTGAKHQHMYLEKPHLECFDVLI